MKNTEKNIVELNAQLNGVEERVKEIKNELDTLDFQMELYRIDAKLYRMKRKTLMYELELLDKKIGNAVNEVKLNVMLKDLNIDLPNIEKNLYEKSNFN